MRLPTPKRIERTHSLIGWSMSAAALLIGVLMWRACTAIVPPPPIGVYLSSMLWIFCGMIGIFYNARASGLLTTGAATRNATADGDDPLGAALRQLVSLQDQLENGAISLDEYRQARREIIAAAQSQQPR